MGLLRIKTFDDNDVTGNVVVVEPEIGVQIADVIVDDDDDAAAAAAAAAAADDVC